MSLMATASEMPAASINVAAPWRSPWNFTPANPDRAANRSQALLNEGGL